MSEHTRQGKATPRSMTDSLWATWSDKSVVERRRAHDRLRRGWDVQEACETPLIVRTVSVMPDVLEHLREHGPASTQDLITRFPCWSRETLGRSLRAAVRDRVLHVQSERRGRGTVKLYVLGAGPQPEAPASGVPAWVHPIRARLLGLPVATRREEIPIDYAHPMRGAA